MVNPQLTQNLLAMIRSLPSEDRRWLLERLEQDAGQLSKGAPAELAMAGGTFDDLAAEPDLYSFSDGEAIAAG